MAENVVSLTGKTPDALNNGEPNPKVVEFCETLLMNAKSGKLQWLATAQLSCDGFMNTSWVARESDCAKAAGVIALLQHEFLASWSRDSSR